MIDINSTKWEKTVQHLANDGINQFTTANTKSLPTHRINRKYIPLELCSLLFIIIDIIILTPGHVICTAIVYRPVVLLKQKNFYY
jgi:hypothetical protein